MLVPLLLIAAGVGVYLFEKKKNVTQTEHIRPFPGQNDDSVLPVVQPYTAPTRAVDDSIVTAKAPVEPGAGLITHHTAMTSTATADGSSEK
jgi:hypothetical protein